MVKQIKRLEGNFPELSCGKKPGSETGAAVPGICGEWEETKTKVVCVCVCPCSGQQLPDSLTGKLSDIAWLPGGDCGSAVSKETAGSPHFMVLHGCWDLYKLKAQPSTSKKDHSSLYCNPCFIEAFWNGTCRI